MTQDFTQTPAAVSIDKNAPYSIGTAYDVYRRSSLGTFQGSPSTADAVFPWQAQGVDVNDVIYDESHGAKRYAMFPVVITAKQGLMEKVMTLGDDYSLSDAGVAFHRDAAYDIATVAYSSGLAVPMMSIPVTAITAAAGVWTVDPGYNLATAGIVKGLPMAISSSVYTTVVSVVGQVLTLADALVLPSSGSVVIGSKNMTQACCMTRKTGSWLSAGIKSGDIVKFSLSQDPTTTYEASVIALSSSVLTFNTVTAAYPTDITQAFAADISNSGYPTQAKAERLVGFMSGVIHGVTGVWNTDKTVFAADTTLATGVTGTWSAGNTIFTADAAWPAPPVANDVLIIGDGSRYVIQSVGSGNDVTLATAPTGSPAAAVSLVIPATWESTPKVGDVVVCGLSQVSVIAVANNAITVSSAVATAATVDLWRPVVTSTVLADFRAASSDNANVVQKITSLDAIRNIYCKGQEIDDCNELAYMLFIQFQLSGSSVYACNVAMDDLTAYAEALDNSLMQEVYSIAMGTTVSGINALLEPHVVDASQPYTARERIATGVVDLDDVYIVGQGPATATAGVLTDLDFSATQAGVQAGDSVGITLAGITTWATVLVTPTDPDSIATSATTITDSVTVVVRTQHKEVMASKASEMTAGSPSRRVATVFPGWFQATNATGDTRMYPPYYISAGITGVDVGTDPSQSQTNLLWSIPGLSAITLNTNFFFRKEQLDVIGGGGIDIMIQPATVSNQINSRHDLTTDMDSIQYRERSITKQADAVAKAYRKAMSPYIGRYNINGPAGDKLIEFLGQIASIVNSALVKANVCASVTCQSITRDATVADKLNFQVNVTVYVAGNYYDITLNIVS